MQKCKKQNMHKIIGKGLQICFNARRFKQSDQPSNLGWHPRQKNIATLWILLP